MQNFRLIGGAPRKVVTLTVGAAVLSGVLYACGGSGGGSAPAVEVPAAIQVASNARYNIQVVNSVTGALITDPLTLTFFSNATLKALDGSSLNGKTVTITAGLYALDAQFTAAATDFRVQVADAGNKGWIPTGTRVVGEADAKGDFAAQVRLVNTGAAAAVNASPAAVAMAVAPTTAAAGGVLSAVAAVTVPKVVTNAEGAQETIGVAQLAIPATTTGRAADGTPAAPGPVQVTTTYFANANVESLAAFPGGFAASVQVPAARTDLLGGNTASTAAFVTGGFASFNVVDSQGRAIKQFDKPLTVGIDLPKNSLKADGTPIVVGDKYPVWSYNDTTGEWVFEKEGDVKEKTPVDPANFRVEFTTTHLSAWNLDYIPSNCRALINFSGRPAGDTRPLRVDVVGVAGQRFGQSGTITDSQLTVFRAPAIRVNISVFDRGTKVGEVLNRAWCTGGAINLPLTLAPIPTGTVAVEVSESCADGTQVRPVPTSVLLSNVSGFRNGYTLPNSANTAATFSFTTVATGAAQVRVQNPRTGVWSSHGVTVSQNATATVPVRFNINCTPVTGATGAVS